MRFCQWVLLPLRQILEPVLVLELELDLHLILVLAVLELVQSVAGIQSLIRLLTKLV